MEYLGGFSVFCIVAVGLFFAIRAWRDKRAAKRFRTGGPSGGSGGPDRPAR